MDVEPSIAALGAIIGAPARANILSALFDGRTLTASELAYAARVSPQTTSSHLAKLVGAGLIVAERHGRHRFYRIADPAVAEALEPLTHITPHRPAPVRGLSVPLEREREGRMCYDHLAGRLGVAITEALLAKRLLKPEARDFDLTVQGAAFCESLGLDPRAIRAQRRVFARQCLDWSERKPHLAGALGAAITRSLVDRKWIVRVKVGRAVTLTDSGRRALKERIGVRL